MKSINNKIITSVPVYEHKITSTTVGGFARIDQKRNMIGLTVLVDTTVKMNEQDVEIKKGDTIYILEEMYRDSNVKKTYACPVIAEEFHMIDASAVYLVQSPIGASIK